MNKARRKIISNCIRNIEDVLQNVLDDERDAFESMPESLQESYNGQISQDAQDNLEIAIDALEEAVAALEDIV